MTINFINYTSTDPKFNVFVDNGFFAGIEIIDCLFYYFMMIPCTLVLPHWLNRAFEVFTINQQMK